MDQISREDSQMSQDSNVQPSISREDVLRCLEEGARQLADADRAYEKMITIRPEDLQIRLR